MRTAWRILELVTVSPVDVGAGEIHNVETSTTYKAIETGVFSNRNDTRKIAGAPLLTHRYLITSSSLYKIATAANAGAALPIRFARVNGIKYNVDTITADPNGYNVIVELGGMIA